MQGYGFYNFQRFDVFQFSEFWEENTNVFLFIPELSEEKSH